MAKLRYRTLRENVVDEIRMKILNREYEPGMRIVEQNLSDELGVSRGPIREALRQLEQEGLVEYVRNVGCSVKQVTLEDVYEIYLLRATYEQLAVRTYEGQLSDEDLAQMESIVEEMKIFGEDDLGNLVDCDCRFHQVIVEKAGLNRLLKAWTELNYGNIVCYFAGNSDRKEAANRQHGIHERLLNVFKSKDEETICNAISEHYMKTVKRLMKEGSMSDEGFKYKV